MRGDRIARHGFDNRRQIGAVIVFGFNPVPAHVNNSRRGGQVQLDFLALSGERRDLADTLKVRWYWFYRGAHSRLDKLGRRVFRTCRRYQEA